MRAIFFDAGNTLVFADREKTLAPLLSRGVKIPAETISSAERAARRFRDANAASDPQHTDQQYWDIYYEELLAKFPEHRDLIPDLIASTRNSQNWEFVPPGTREELQKLRNRYRLAIISNSDGRMADLFVRLGLAELFETITDSGKVGVQKPHPDIFRAALQSLNVQPEESVYIGDVYSIDYAGARGVGMHAIVMDPFGTYTQNGVPRVTKLSEIARFLESASW